MGKKESWLQYETALHNYAHCQMDFNRSLLILVTGLPALFGFVDYSGQPFEYNGPQLY